MSQMQLTYEGNMLEKTTNHLLKCPNAHIMVPLTPLEHPESQFAELSEWIKW